jgi:murein DD-endopeptidase MepM/ murein hydrolase activator NlpD
MDIACPVGTPVYAAFAGVVREAGEMDPDLYGRSGIGARVENPDTESQYYGHLSELFVKPGDTVRLGQIIGLSGATGNVSGPHLHFECWTAGGKFSGMA